jgi:hypothetical protein
VEAMSPSSRLARNTLGFMGIWEIINIF